MRRTIIGICITLAFISLLTIESCVSSQTTSKTTTTQPGSSGQTPKSSVPTTSAPVGTTISPPSSLPKSIVIEDWDQAKPGTYFTGKDQPFDIISGLGWIIWSSASENNAEIITEASGNKYTKITSFVGNFGLATNSLINPLEIPIYKGTKLSFEASGKLNETPLINRLGFEVSVKDGKKRSYKILYKFWPINNIGDFDKASLVIPLTRKDKIQHVNLYGDLLQFKDFEPNGAVINKFELSLVGSGWATLDNLQIDYSNPEATAPTAVGFGFGSPISANKELESIKTGALVYMVDKGIKEPFNKDLTIVTSDINWDTIFAFGYKPRAVYTLKAYDFSVLSVNDPPINPWPQGMMFNTNAQSWEYINAVGIYGSRGF